MKKPAPAMRRWNGPSFEPVVTRLGASMEISRLCSACRLTERARRRIGRLERRGSHCMAEMIDHQPKPERREDDYGKPAAGGPHQTEQLGESADLAAFARRKVE